MKTEWNVKKVWKSESAKAWKWKPFFGFHFNLTGHFIILHFLLLFLRYLMCPQDQISLLRTWLEKPLHKIQSLQRSVSTWTANIWQFATLFFWKLMIMCSCKAFMPHHNCVNEINIIWIIYAPDLHNYSHWYQLQASIQIKLQTKTILTKTKKKL